MAALISCSVKQKQSEAICVLDLDTSVIHTYILHEKTVPFYFITYYLRISTYFREPFCWLSFKL